MLNVQEAYRPCAGIEMPDIPTTDTNSREYIFWKEEIRRCLKGYICPEDGKYINGIQYFYNNHVKTDYYHPGLKKIVEDECPLWRDNDNDITDYFWANLPRLLPNGKFQGARSHIEIKARRKGWTYIDLLAVNLYLFVFYPGKLLIGSAYPGDDDNIDSEREMFRKAWNGLHPIFKRWKGHNLEIVIDNLSNGNGQFKIGYPDLNNPKSKIIHSGWVQKTVTDITNPGVFKGDAYKRINVVEAGKWKTPGLLKMFLAQNVDCLRFGGDMLGGYSIGGTSDEIKGIDTDYKQIYFDKKSYNYSRHMTSAVKVHASFFNVETGKTDEEAALQYELAQRESKKNDFVAYQTHIVENPLNEEEMFIPNAQYAYNTATLQNQQIHINHHELDAQWIRGILEAEVDLNGKPTGGYNFKENPKGEWLVHEKYGLPDYRFKNLYIGAIDDKYKSQKQRTVQSGSSKSAMLVKIRKHDYDYPSDRVVAILLTPSFDLLETFQEFHKAMCYWSIEKSLYEYNHEAFVHFLRNKNALNRLHYVDDAPGISATGKNGILKELTLLGNTFMSEGRYQNIDSTLIIDALKKWGGPENTDIGTAFHLLLQLEEWIKETPVTLAVEEGKFQAKFMLLGNQQNAARFIQLGRPNQRTG